MGTGITSDSAITPGAVEGRLARQMLKVGVPKNNMEKAITLTEDQPEKSTRVVRWARYAALPVSTVVVDEGITPVAVQMEREEVSASLDQHIGLVQTTDVLHYFHPDFTVSVATQRLGEQAATTIETKRYNVFKAGTVLRRANGSARTDINTAMDITDLRWAERALARALAEYFTDLGMSTPDFNTESILPAYWGFIHPDARYVVEGISGFTSVKDYGHGTEIEPNELGAIGNIRFLMSTVYAPFASAGGAKGSMISTDGTSADVYTCTIVGREAWGSVSFRGKNSIQPFTVVPSHTAADPAAQRGYVGWVAWTQAKILNDSWMCRIEFSVPELS
jgi:N4-gp56 family major capsid protein